MFGLNRQLSHSHLRRAHMYLLIKCNYNKPLRVDISQRYQLTTKSQPSKRSGVLVSSFQISEYLGVGEMAQELKSSCRLCRGPGFCSQTHVIVHNHLKLQLQEINAPF